MRKKRDHRSKRDFPGIRAVPEESGDGGDEVVRLDSEGVQEGPKVERLKVGRPVRVKRSRPSGSRTELAVDLKSDTPEVDGVVEEVKDLEELWEGGRSKIPKVPIGWVVVLIGFVVSVLVVALWKIPKGDSNLDRKVAKVAEMLEVERQNNIEAAGLADQIQNVIEAYLEAETVEEKLKYVRMPARVRPLMEDYYKAQPLVPTSAGVVYHFEPVAVGNYPFVLLKMALKKGGTVMLLLEETQDGEVKVDWESQVAYQVMTLDEFVEKRPTEGVEFRVLVEYDEYYSFEFSDSDRYVSLMIKERDDPGFLFGYVERYSDTHDELIEILGKERGVMKPMILKVRFLPGGRGARTVLVEEVVSPGWAVVSAPGEEGGGGGRSRGRNCGCGEREGVLGGGVKRGGTGNQVGTVHFGVSPERDAGSAMIDLVFCRRFRNNSPRVRCHDPVAGPAWN